MPRFWVIAPVESKKPELFDRVWQFDLANNLISIGWTEVGDISMISREKLDERIASAYPEKPAQTKGLYANMLWAFYHEIVPGDVILARRGRKKLTAVGKVTRSAIHSPGKNPAISHPSFLEVTWQDQPRNKLFPAVVFPMHTVAELTEDEYHSFVEGSGIQAVPPESAETLEDPAAFVLEKYLEDFVVSNFEMIFRGKLKIYQDAEGNDGQQYSTEIGPIDILALEPKSNSFVVIELKKGRPADQVVGQILRYMGWVKRNLCKEGQAVRGMIVCRDPDAKLSYALEMTSTIEIRYYSVSFKLTETPWHLG
jgi:restriction system protein